MSDLVFAALPHHNCRRCPIDFADVMNPVVRHLVVLIHILRARPVAVEQDADAACVSDLVARDMIVHASEIQAVLLRGWYRRIDSPVTVQPCAPRRRTSAVGLSECSQLCCNSPFVSAMPRERSPPVKVSPSNTEPRHRHVLGPVVVDASFDAKQLRQFAGLRLPPMVRSPIGHKYSFRSDLLKTHSPGSSSTSRMFSTQTVSFMNLTRPIARDAGTIGFRETDLFVDARQG